MSGYKHATVTISQEEYRRLHEADMKKRFREYASLKAQNSERGVDTSKILQQMENRQRQLEQALQTLAQNFTSIDEETVQDIMIHHAQCYEQLAATLDESAADVQTSLVSMAERFEEEIQRERHNQRQNLQALVQRMDGIRQNEHAKGNYAWDCLAQATILANFIQEQFDHERFVPGKLAGILRYLDLARSNLEQGFFEASLQNSQQSFLELSDLHFELEQRVLQWQAEFERTCTAVRAITDTLEATARVNALGLQGEVLPNQVDLDFWTNGKYVQLLGHCRKLMEFLAEDQHSLTMEDMSRVYHQILPAIRESFESFVYEARFHALNSQLRMNIAEKAMQALEHHGFALSEAGYTDSDMRAPFNAQLESPDGSQVLIQVLPTKKEEDELANDLVVITHHQSLKTEHETRMQWEELSRTLSQYNLKVSRPDILPAPPSEAPGITERLRLPDQKIIHVERSQDV